MRSHNRGGGGGGGASHVKIFLARLVGWDNGNPSYWPTSSHLSKNEAAFSSPNLSFMDEDSKTRTTANRISIVLFMIYCNSKDNRTGTDKSV